MQFHIAEPNANLAIGAVWSNHSDSTKLIVLGGLDKLKDFAVSREKNIAFLEVSLILNHMYNIPHKHPFVKSKILAKICTILLRGVGPWP